MPLKENFLFVLLNVFFFCLPSNAGVGESAVITLVFPFGARCTGMGEVGTSLADDESALFYNPAGLGISNQAWKDGSLSGFYEQLLPEFGIPDLFHVSHSAYYQPDKSTIGGFGVFTNYINMGQNEITDMSGRISGTTQSWEMVNAIGWGFNFSEKGHIKNNFGITCKLFESALAAGYGSNGEGTAQSFAIDFGYLYLSRCGLRIGATLMNMGPNIYYIDKNNSDPIPFTINLALGYKQRFFFGDILNFSIATESRLDRELVRNNFDGHPDPFYKAIYTDIADKSFKENMQEANYHFGFELGIMNTGFFRHGFLIDPQGERYEETFGFGLKLFNHLNWDLSWIYAPEGFMKHRFTDDDEGATGIRNGQTRFSITYASVIRKWSDDDCRWWRSR